MGSDCGGQLRQQKVERMIRFVEEEGAERSRELDVLSKVEAFEAFADAVEAGKRRADRDTAKKEEALKQKRTLEISGIVKTYRLMFLNSREEVISQLFQEAKSKIEQVIKNQTFYKPLLLDLIVQALLLASGEEEVGIRIIQRDARLMKPVLRKALIKFQLVSGRDLNVALDGGTFLLESCLGGVHVFARAGRLKIDNTLSSRLNQVRRGFLELARFGLFGPNPHRVFMD